MAWRRQRVSPVDFAVRPAETVTRDGWTVVVRFEKEAQGPWIIDLSHRPKWDLQSAAIDEQNPWGLQIPKAPGDCVVENGLVVCRMNPMQAFLWDLGHKASGHPSVDGVTELTDGLCLLGFLGHGIQKIMEKLSPLDLQAPSKSGPYLIQGPVGSVPCQVVVFQQFDPMVAAVAFSRGYGQSMAEAFLAAGREIGLRPGGELRFLNWLNGAAGRNETASRYRQSSMFAH
ncbi:sarcosine oxidase subunit gamma SoxG [Desulfosoma caldarium]|uniref:Uncharacterized protein n=1 Tax=Desulfosoma caldarium TaxID=610254 RepID=A0A3N1UQ17_9BACT|nr:sarcosine oxidase subunit gamma SoxG [Desulfosoma caldarium]ROQ92153.1 hypothetical protein EDC27_1837 [Desulfosoma caldarium]